MNLVQLWAFVCLLCISLAQNDSVLAYVDLYSKFVRTQVVYPTAYHGVSLQYNQIATSPGNTSPANSSLFQAYIRNSFLFNTRRCGFVVSMKMQYPMGNKLNCNALPGLGLNLTCSTNISSTSAQLYTFMKNVASSAQRQIVIGYDMQKANFTDPGYKSYFIAMMDELFLNFGFGAFSNRVQLVQNGQLFDSLGIINGYNISTFVNDMLTVFSFNLGHKYMGPGISDGANQSWLESYNSFSTSPDFIFTLKCVIFKNESSVTLADVMDQNNYKNYLVSRMTNNGILLVPIQYLEFEITQMKLTSGLGINGITNSFASALWAIDMALEFRLLGGSGIKFVIDLDPNNYHSVLGPAPTYTPNPIYYGLMMLSFLSYVNPEIILPTIRGGSSLNIKSYAFGIQNQMQIVILNKDVRENASGIVVIEANYTDRIECLYLSAPSLSSTTGVTFAGLSFIGGNSAPQGNYTVIAYDHVNYSYNIPVNYSQAVMCFLGNPNTKFPYSQKSQSFLYILPLLLTLSLLLHL